MNGFWVALGFLTRFPTPPLAPERSDISQAAPWLPVVGALVGVCVALAVAVGAHVGPWVGALLGVVAWVVITGGLHVEGLGDVTDGLGAAHGNKERFLAVARDPHLGGFGAIAIVLQLMAKLVLLASVALKLGTGEAVAGLILVAAWARWGTLVQACAVPPLADGLGSRFAAGVTVPVIALEAVVLAAASLYVAPFLLVALSLAALFTLYWRSRLGGITGDCHGAAIEITESILLLVLLAS